MKKLFLFTSFLCCFSLLLKAQEQISPMSKADGVIALPDKLFGALDKKSREVEGKLDKQTDKYLAKLSKQEEKLKKKLWKRDSLTAKALFPDINERYIKLKNTSGKLQNAAGVYSPHLDSLSTALSFLKEGSLTSLKENPALEKSLAQYNSLQEKFNQTDQIKKYLTQRENLLKEQFQRLGMIKELKKFRKEVYYYQAQVKEYKAMFEDPSKLEAKLVELALKIPQFKDFFARNSQLGSLFALPGGSSGGVTPPSLQGLQTRASVNQLIQNRFGSSAAATAALRQNVQGAQGQLSALKDKVAKYSSGSLGNSSDVETPDFKPNNQKTKSFLKRLEWGSNMQTVKGNRFFPVTSDLGLSLGYKLNDKSVIGVGAAYKMGWGSGWNNICITHQGVGLRSYLDYKIKSAIYLSGGYEQSYRAAFQSIDQLKNYSAWQTSGLIGLSKKYQVSKKFKGEVKLLWDFLSYQQIPKTQAILFRVGYSLK